MGQFSLRRSVSALAFFMVERQAEASFPLQKAMMEPFAWVLGGDLGPLFPLGIMVITVTDGVVRSC